MCLIANIKRNDFFFDLSTSDKSNSVPQTGGKCTTKGKLQGWQWDQSEAFAQSSFSKRCPPSLSPETSCHALTQSEKNLPSPDVTLSQDALCADISSGGPRAPPTHRKTESISFLSGSRILPAGGHRELLPAGTAQPRDEPHIWGWGGGRVVSNKYWDHFITSPEAPFLPATANKAPWAPLPALREPHVCLTHSSA